MMVFDASAALELILRTKRGDAVAALITDPGETLHAPHLLDVEVTEVLRRLSRSGKISSMRSNLAFDVYQLLGITRYDHRPLLARVWELKDVLSAYDATYVALAETLSARLVTFDKPIATAKHNAVVLCPDVRGY